MRVKLKKKIIVLWNVTPLLMGRQQLTTKRLLLVDLSAGRISIICNQRVERSVGAMSYHNVTQHCYDFIVQTNNAKKCKFKP
jgi:hypothetical protein